LRFRLVFLLVLCVSFSNAFSQIMDVEFDEMLPVTNSSYDIELARNTRGSMMFDSNNDLHLIYTERTEGSSDIGASGLLYYQRLSDELWSERLSVRSNTGQDPPFDHGGNPALYVTSDGSIHFTWHDYRNSTSSSGLDNIDIYYRCLFSTGDFQSTEIQITSHDENQYRPMIFGMPDDRVIIGWYDFLREEGPDFLLESSDVNYQFDIHEDFQTQLVEDANTDNEPIPGSHFFLGVVIPQFEIDSQGRVHAVWTTGFMEAQGTLNYGVIPELPDRSMSLVQRVSQTGSNFYDPPKIRVDQNDAAWILWTERVEGNYENIWLTRKTIDDETVQTPVQITDYDVPNVVEYPDFAIGPDGLIYIVWADKRDDEWDLFLRVYDPLQDSLSDEMRLTDHWETKDTRPCIEIDSNGRVVIVWQRTNEEKTELFYLQSKRNVLVDHWKDL
jgi:hypothetical protein